MVCGHCRLTLPLTVNETLTWISSLLILMQESFWLWHCSDRSPSSTTTIHPFPPPTPVSPSLISLIVSVDVKHHVYLLGHCELNSGCSYESAKSLLYRKQNKNKQSNKQQTNPTESNKLKRRKGEGGGGGGGGGEDATANKIKNMFWKKLVNWGDLKKIHINIGKIRAQEVCESRGGRPGLPVPNKPDGFCGRKATLKQNSGAVWKWRWPS